MQQELEPMRANSARATRTPRVSTIVAATAFLVVLAVAAWAMAGPAPLVAKREMAAVGLKLEKLDESLPRQHVMVFVKAGER